ncbi:MAG: 2-isopropylmalate synthase, partial [Chloroflexi bacterium]|nr:2-isopropylmalate synthase [Chloroflexota bacterium]
LEQVIQAGATTVNIPDTVGYAVPEQFEALIRGVFANVPSIGKVRVSVHCHNDLGLATANTLAAVRAGARQVEGCINGLGERAGNASLEEVVMGLTVRKDYFGVTTGINTNQLYRTSRLVSDLTGMPVQPNKAIVGANAFRHESGIHQDALLKHRQTFEIMDPHDVGVPASVLHLGKTSGRAGFRAHLKEMGYDLSEEDFTRTWNAFKDLVNKKKTVSDRDVEALIAEEMRVGAEQSFYQLEQVQVMCGEPGVPTASVRLRGPDGQIQSASAIGDGPVDAVYKAISRIVAVPNQLAEFSVKSITESTEAMGDVTIRIQSEGFTFTGRGVSTDILVASARAYVNALNRLLAAQGRAAAEVVR